MRSYWKYRLTSLAKHITVFPFLQRSSGFIYPVRQKAIHLGLVFIITIVVVGFFSVMEVDPHHDGIMLKPAVDVANGKMLFRDSFSQYGALTILVQALAIKVFGGGLITIRFLTALSYGLIAALQWLIYSRLLPIWANAISWAIWLSLGYFFLGDEIQTLFPAATSFPVFSVLLGVYLLILFLENGKQRYMWMCGVVTAGTFWLKINFGIIHFGFMAQLLILLEFSGASKNRIRSIYVFGMAYCLAHLGFLIWLFVNDSLKDFWIQSIKFAYLFAMQDQFSTNTSFFVRAINCLFQINSRHVSISVLWTFLPIISAVIFGCVCYSYIKKGTTVLQEKVVLATSLASTWLWLSYFPVNSVNQMYLGSVLFVGMVFYLLWGITQSIPARWRNLVRLVCIILIFYQDISVRVFGCIEKVEKFSGYEKIETPSFLRGMYVPPREALVYTKIGSILQNFPQHDLINLTRDGLYSLYNLKNHDFHKMHLNWGWTNTVLYPDYLVRLRDRIAARSNIIIANDSFCIEGYIPVAVFLEMGKLQPKPRVVLHIPAESSDEFKVLKIGSACEKPEFSSGCDFPLIQIALTSDEPISIDSLVVKVYYANLVYRRLNRYDFEYDVLPRVTDRRQEELLKQWYQYDEKLDDYTVFRKSDPLLTSRILDVVDDLFLCERFSSVANSFRHSGNRQIVVFWRGRVAAREGEDLSSVQITKEDPIEIVPFLRLFEPYILKLRINFNRGRYYETTIRSWDR